MTEQCAICGCPIHRKASTYALPGVAGRSHATKHYYVAQRFFGRSRNRHGAAPEGIFSSCPWKQEGKYGLVCYECREELLRNPVLLAEDVSELAEIVAGRGLREKEKTDSRLPIAGRVALLHEVIAVGIASVRRRDARLARLKAIRELAPFLGGFATVFLLVGFSPWYEAFSASENVSVEGWAFFLAGLLVCAMAPAHPFRAAIQGTFGVFAGATAGIIAHVIVNGGSEGTFFPLDAAGHTGMSAPGFLLSALVWKAASEPIFWNMRELLDVVSVKLAARQSALLESLNEDIEALKNMNGPNGPTTAESIMDGVVAICSNALYALAEAVLVQYDGLLAESLVSSPLARDKLARGIPDQLRPLLEQCVARMRREANVAGVPETASACISRLEGRFDAICGDIALTLRASSAERNRVLLRDLAEPLLGRLARSFRGGAN